MILAFALALILLFVSRIDCTSLEQQHVEEPHASHAHPATQGEHHQPPPPPAHHSAESEATSDASSSSDSASDFLYDVDDIDEHEMNDFFFKRVHADTKALLKKFHKVIHVGEDESAKMRLPKHDHRVDPTAGHSWSGTLTKVSLDAGHAMSFIDELLGLDVKMLLAEPEKSYEDLVEKFEKETKMVFNGKLMTDEGGDPRLMPIVKHKNCSPALFFDKIINWPAFFDMVGAKWHEKVSARLQALFKLHSIFVFLLAVIDKSYRLHYHVSKTEKKKHKQKAYMDMPMMLEKRMAAGKQLVRWALALEKTLRREGKGSSEVELLVANTLENFIQQTEIVVREKCADPDCNPLANRHTHAVATKTQRRKQKRSGASLSTSPATRSESDDEHGGSRHGHAHMNAKIAELSERLGELASRLETLTNERRGGHSATSGRQRGGGVVVHVPHEQQQQPAPPPRRDEHTPEASNKHNRDDERQQHADEEGASKSVHALHFRPI